MNKKLKIKQLWHYLKIQDELLVIQVHNSSSGADEYLVVEMVNDELQIHTVSELQDVPTGNLRIVSYRDDDGNLAVPDVDRIARERESDY